MVRSTYNRKEATLQKLAFERLASYSIDTPALAGYDHFNLGVLFALLQTSLACELKTAMEC